MKVTRQKIAKTLRKSVFTPSKPGPMRIILDVGDTDYYVKRAIELLTVVLDNNNPVERSRELTWAISLLAVSKILIDGEE